MSCAPVNRARTFGHSCGAGVMCASEFKHFHKKKFKTQTLIFSDVPYSAKRQRAFLFFFANRFQLGTSRFGSIQVVMHDMHFSVGS